MASLNYLTFKPGKAGLCRFFLQIRAGSFWWKKFNSYYKKENEAFLCMTDEECRLMLELYEKYNNALKNKFKEL